VEITCRNAFLSHLRPSLFYIRELFRLAHKLQLNETLKMEIGSGGE